MTKIRLFRDTVELLVKEVAITMMVYKGRGTDELFVTFDREALHEIDGPRTFTTSKEYPMLCHAWIGKDMHGDAALVVLGPQWQLCIDGENLPLGIYREINIAGRKISFRYKAYRFVGQFPGTPKGTIAEIAERCAPVLQHIIDDLLS
ncbi:MAG: hypothetical protein AAGF95_08540 [Chloroflexota bacterium]